MRALALVLGAVLTFSAGCAIFTRTEPLVQIEPSGAAETAQFSRLQRLSEVFYTRIINRRFNSVATYRDPALVEFFHSQQAYSDYYAEFAQALTDARVEASRPTEARIEAVALQGPGVALVRVHFSGQNSRPLRPWKSRLVREDRWEFSDGRWWILPGKL